jgi:hypothetical protein
VKTQPVGQFLFIAGHEVGHAMFDLLKVPHIRQRRGRR